MKLEFQANPDWIGPVRKMQGIGNNDRSDVYPRGPSTLCHES